MAFLRELLKFSDYNNVSANMIGKGASQENLCGVFARNNLYASCIMYTYLIFGNMGVTSLLLFLRFC